MLKIDDARHELISDDNGDITVIQKFLTEDILKDEKYTLYLYADDANNHTELYVKFGKAIGESVYDRYHSTGNKQNQKMLAVWESTIADEPIHAKLKKRASVLRGYTYETDYNKVATEEAYRIYTKEGLLNIMADISEFTKTEAMIEKKYRPDFSDVQQVVEEVLTVKDKPVLEDLCVRFGKTGTHALLYKELEARENIKINVIGSYVGTVKHSYSDEINTLKNNEHCLFIDVDDDLNTNYKKIKEHIKISGKYVVIYLPLTGDEDTCFTRRTKLISKLKSEAMTMLIEEADFGAKCHKQVKKIYSLVKNTDYNFKHFYVTTGTDADKWINILGSDVYIIRRDYITDLLGVRKEATKIVWNVLNNSNMINFGYSVNEMENWDDMLAVNDDGRLKNEVYIEQVLDYILLGKLPVNTKATRSLAKSKLLNSDTATIIFTARGNEKHKALKQLIEQRFPGYSVLVLDSNYTSNVEAEEAAKQLVKAHYELYHNYNVIFISTDMANRSFSLKEIKNVVYMCNSGNPIQKGARGLTYWAERPDVPCRIVDFRLNYYNSNLSTYLGSLAINSLAPNATHKSVEELTKVLEERIATDKLTFNEYFAVGENPIKQISLDELKYHMQSNTDYRRNLANKVVYEELPLIDSPRVGTIIPEETLNLNAVVNSNLKGDTDQTVRLKNHQNKNNTNESEDADQSVDSRILLLNYLLNHSNEFNSHMYETDILKNEFQYNMSVERQQALEAILNIDMHVVCQIADILIKHGIDIYK